jgi:curved DNA-binding protein CbpA
MDNRRNYYRILQVQPDAPFEIIRTSYLTHLQKLKQHPDLGGDHWNATVLNEAFETLKDEEKRAEYDKELFQHYTKNFSAKDKEEKQPVTTIFCPFCKRALARAGHSDQICVCNNSAFQTESQDSKSESGKRSIIRIQKLEKFHFITTTSEEIYEAQMVDLSPKGMRFICKKALNLNEIIKIDNSLFRAIAEINSSQKRVKDRNVSYSIGAHFHSISFTDQEGTFLSTSV